MDAQPPKTAGFTVAAEGAVLGLAEMELIFPLAALIVLCFVLVARKVLITHRCFGYY